MPDPAAALAELARVIRPGGELRFFEHFAARSARLAEASARLDASGSGRAKGGCRTRRDTEAAIMPAGFGSRSDERFTFHPTVLDIPVAPKILGRARRR